MRLLWHRARAGWSASLERPTELHGSQAGVAWRGVAWRTLQPLNETPVAARSCVPLNAPSTCRQAGGGRGHTTVRGGATPPTDGRGATPTRTMWPHVAAAVWRAHDESRSHQSSVHISAFGQRADCAPEVRRSMGGGADGWVRCRCWRLGVGQRLPLFRGVVRSSATRGMLQQRTVSGLPSRKSWWGRSSSEYGSLER